MPKQQEDRSSAVDLQNTAQIFKQLLIKSNINAYRLAKETGIDKTYLSKLFNGAISKPGQDKLIKIAGFLNIELEQMQQIFSNPTVAIQELGLEDTILNQSPTIKSRQDWGAAPDGIVCYYRQTEIDLIRQWIEQKSCRLITIYGLEGIGKTTITMEIARQLETEFQYIFWRILDNVPLTEIVIQDALQLFTKKKPKATIAHQITELVHYLKTNRCLLILDRLETVLAVENSLETYQNGYQAYGELLRQIAQTQHQSCLLLVSDEKPKDVAVWESSSASVHSLQVRGSTEVCYQILRDKGIPQSSAWNELIEVYRGHPLAIKIVATTIDELFNGDVAEFLRQNTLFLGDIKFILHQQYQRLSSMEKEIIKTIAQHSKPLSLNELTEKFTPQLRCSEIMDYLNILKRRSLIEITQLNSTNCYTLQPMVRKYINSQI